MRLAVSFNGKNTNSVFMRKSWQGTHSDDTDVRTHCRYLHTGRNNLRVFKSEKITPTGNVACM